MRNLIFFFLTVSFSILASHGFVPPKFSFGRLPNTVIPADYCSPRKASLLRLEMKTYYDILGVPKTAKASEIKRAYRRAALKNHPDVSTDPDAEKKFMKICEAYEVLSDEEQRRKYDVKLNMGFGSSYSGSSSSYSSRSRASSSSSSYGTDYNYEERAERRRQWEAANPTPDQLDDSFGAIFADLLGKVAGAAVTGGSGGILEDLVTFLEKGVDGYSAETSLEFEELLASSNAKELRLEMENTELLLTQLKAKQIDIKRNLALAEAAVLEFKAKNKVVSDISVLDQEMELIEKVAGLAAREKEVKGHIGRAEARYQRLRKRIDQLESSSTSYTYNEPRSSNSQYTGYQKSGSQSSTRKAQNPFSRSDPYSDSITDELAKLKKKLGK